MRPARAPRAVHGARHDARLAMLGALVLSVAGARGAHADATVSVTLDAQGQKLAADLGVSEASLVADAEARIDELYRLSNLEGLLQSFGDTAAFASRDLGVAYDPDPGDIMFGLAAGGVHGNIAIGTTSELLGGSILNLAAMTGVNLARWGHPRWTLFGSGFYEATTIHGLEGHLFTAGVHGQARVLAPRGSRAARWTGVAVTSGVEYAHWTIGATSAIESHFTAHGASGDKTIHMSSTGPLAVRATTTTVPVEITTGVRFGGVFGLYAGGGLALVTGDSSISAQLDSVLSINSDRREIGSATISGAAEATPNAVAGHVLAGVELHFRHVRVFAQGSLASGEQAVGLGVRVVP